MTKTVNEKYQLGFINQKIINASRLESFFCFSIQHEPAIDSLLPLTGNPQIIDSFIFNPIILSYRGQFITARFFMKQERNLDIVILGLSLNSRQVIFIHFTCWLQCKHFSISI